MTDDPFQLLGNAYFHQDWDMDGTDRDVVELFALDNPELIHPTLVRITQLQEWSEAQLAKYFDANRFYYDPRPTGTSYIEWLGCLERWLRESVR